MSFDIIVVIIIMFALRRCQPFRPAITQHGLEPLDSSRLDDHDLASRAAPSVGAHRSASRNRVELGLNDAVRCRAGADHSEIEADELKFPSDHLRVVRSQLPNRRRNPVRFNMMPIPGRERCAKRVHIDDVCGKSTKAASEHECGSLRGGNLVVLPLFRGQSRCCVRDPNGIDVNELTCGPGCVAWGQALGVADRAL